MTEQHNKPYTTHLCTFMGREANLKILIPYIDKALEMNAVDNYWFIDMTRKRSDHELIKKLSAELNVKYPGRVHLYNSEERGKIIDDKEKLAEATQSWETFYKFLRRFNDNDIIAKCDDDTYYIDVETLKAAYEFRWNNKKPYLMHSNCINNGLPAYHGNKKGIWKDKETAMYPRGGLTGPLFSHPEIACKHHEQFTTDMLKNREHINKYKLNKNIQFCNRISINFIFMLGSDRHELSKITYQDEYDTSSKYPQRENRPNVIIGDFTIAHHTYGVQEPVMEKLKTHVGYEKLCKALTSPDMVLEHKSINTDLNATTTINAGNKLLARAWVEDNSYIIQDPDTDEYLCIRHDDIDQAHSTAQKSNPDVTKNIKNACIFNIDVEENAPIYYHNSTSLLKSLVNCTNNGEMTFPFAVFFQGNYKKMTYVCEKQKNGNYIIRCGSQREYFLTRKDPERIKSLKTKDELAFNKLRTSLFVCNKNNMSVQQDKQWRLIPLKQFVNTCVPMTIKRPSNFSRVGNDETIATSQIDNLPNNDTTREWIWMVKDYIWEFVPTNKKDIYHIKLVADDKDDLYLGHKRGQVETGPKKHLWLYDQKKNTLQHVRTGMYLTIQNTTVTLSKKPIKLNISPKQ